MLGIAYEIEKVVGTFLRDLPDSRGKVSVTYDADGIAHLKGAIDTKARTIDPIHSAFGYTNQDVTDLRKQLAEIGVKLSLADVEAIVIDGCSALSRGTMFTMDPKARREHRRAWMRQHMQERRQWARENGYCIICTKNAAGYRDDGSQLSTCRECQNKANEAKKHPKPQPKKRSARKAK